MLKKTTHVGHTGHSVQLLAARARLDGHRGRCRFADETYDLWARCRLPHLGLGDSPRVAEVVSAHFPSSHGESRECTTVMTAASTRRGKIETWSVEAFVCGTWQRRRTKTMELSLF